MMRLAFGTILRGILEARNYRTDRSIQILRKLSTSTNHSNKKEDLKRKLAHGPGLKDFLTSSSDANDARFMEALETNRIPYLINDNDLNYARPRKVYFDVYGCQMNVNDTEIVWSILKNAGFEKTNSIKEADVALMVTCAIRDHAEFMVWENLNHLRGEKNRRMKINKSPLRIGILGCMAERLKEKLIEKERCVDLVAGPDSYKDLPRMLALTENNQTAVNVLLSLDETYADVTPIRLNEDSVTGFVSIMRGCDNMCTYCIVPFTRGKERSRPNMSILDEVKYLQEQGVKEVTLLGQNVNSYRDLSESVRQDVKTPMAKGFKTVYKVKSGGLRFADLLDKVSSAHPDMRIRFTSPHPKDFPDEVLQIIKERPNICKNLHMPAQSGSSTVLERMRRGYSRDVYLDLISNLRNIIPTVTLSSDFICGFCGETDEEFADTISLIREVKYHMAYMFAYSVREKTTAHRRYRDDVPHDVKIERLKELATVFRQEADIINKAEIGNIHLVLVEGKSKRSHEMLAGRNDFNTKIIIPRRPVASYDAGDDGEIVAGDFVAVRVTEANSQVLKGVPLFRSTIAEFDRLQSSDLLKNDILIKERVR